MTGAGSERPLPVAFVVLTWNQREQTLRCLESLETAGYPLARVVLWDNGSIDGTDDVVRERFPAVLFHRHPVNQGVATGRNSGARLALRAFAPTHLLFLDNDMVVTPGFAEALLEPFAENPRQGQSVAKIRFLKAPGHLHSAGGQVVNFALGMKRSRGNGEIDCGQYDRRRACLPSGGATLVSVAAFRELGGFDAVFDPFGAEDLDFAFRARKAGWAATFVPEAVVYHDYRRKNAAGHGGAGWIAARVKQWLIVFHRHATWPEKLAFFCGGALVGATTLLVRQWRYGDVASLSGIPAGVAETFRDPSRTAEPASKPRDVGIEAD